MPKQKISRVLFPAKGGMMIINLGCRLLGTSSDLPGSYPSPSVQDKSLPKGSGVKRAASPSPAKGGIGINPSLFGLALKWGLPSPMLPPDRVVSYTTFSPLPFSRQRRDQSGIFSVALSVPCGPSCYEALCPGELGLSFPRQRRGTIIYSALANLTHFS